MSVRKAVLDDLGTIMKIYDIARKYMYDSGNLTQWRNGYPSVQLLKDDIKNNQCYVCENEGRIHGVFAFIIGADSTYAVIKDGEWKTDEPYGTIHRIAADGTENGVFNQCFQFCKSQISNVRADTHEDNKTMQHLLEKHNFQRCGIITIADGTPRIAYHYVD